MLLLTGVDNPETQGRHGQLSVCVCTCRRHIDATFNNRVIGVFDSRETITGGEERREVQQQFSCYNNKIKNKSKENGGNEVLLFASCSL